MLPFNIASHITHFIEHIYDKHFYYRVFHHPVLRKIIQNEFHKLYYYQPERTWRNTYWLNTQTLKVPFDLWIYQEIISEVKPDIIIETGTAYGGSALYMATIFDALGKGKVITIDIVKNKQRPRHKRIHYLHGSSVSEAIVRKVRSLIHKNDTVMVVLDSNHTREHVLNELRLYHSFVTKHSYLIVEDTHLHGFPVKPNFPREGGPMEAVKDFLEEHNDFSTDTTREKFFLTFFPGGFLKKTI